MKIDEQAFVEAIEIFNYEKQEEKTSLSDLKKDVKSKLKPLNDFIAQNIKADKIASAELDVVDQEIRIKLQTSIINLPLDYGKQINKIMVNDGEVPVNVYMVIKNPYVTHSKLRIDELGEGDAFAENPNGEFLDKFAEWVEARLTDIETNKVAAEEKEDSDKK